jgi:uncharacterized protein
MAEVSEREIAFESAGQPAVRLEGVLSLSPAGGDWERPAVLLCHPQPASSTMDDPLTRQLATDLAAAGLVVLRFNFRGVGHSEGQQTDGRLEPLDIAGAVDVLLRQPEAHGDKLCLIGHAFGGIMALTYAAHDTRVGMCVAVSPPVFRLAAGLGAFERPKLFVTGEYDEVSPQHKLEPWIAGLPGGRHLSVVSGARHLMPGYETVASSTIVKYVTRWAALPGI